MSIFDHALVWIVTLVFLAGVGIGMLLARKPDFHDELYAARIMLLLDPESDEPVSGVIGATTTNENGEITIFIYPGEPDEPS